MRVLAALFCVGFCGCGARAPDGPRDGHTRPLAPRSATTTATSEPAAAPAPPPSALTGLGVREVVSVDGAGTGARAAAERAIAEASPALARCFRASLDRDPTLKGSVSFTISLGPHGHAAGLVTKAGDLASLPSARCAADVLGRVAVPGAGDKARVEYSVTFTGTHRAPEIPRDRPPPIESFTTVDWAAPGGAPDSRFALPFREIAGELRRCVHEDGPPRAQAVWILARIGVDGAPLLEPAREEEAGDEASLCVRRKLAAARVSGVGRPFATSVLLGGPAFGPPPPPTQPVSQPAPREDEGEVGMIGILDGGIGESFGAGGLGIVGTGPGGGGVGGIGTIGIGGGGTGQGNGLGSGRLGGAHRKKPPSVRMGATTVSGRLPPEVIQRIVRQNFGRFRLCYENGLRNKPSLAGRVVVKFVIARDGSVSKVGTEGDMPDKAVMACVGRAFWGLSFPQPEGGVVSVTYPIHFAPGEGAPASSPKTPPPPPEPTVDARPLSRLDASFLQRVLAQRGFSARLVPSPAGEAAPPLVFARDTTGVHVVRLAQKPEGDAGCSATSKAATLVVAGPTCKRVTDALVD